MPAGYTPKNAKGVGGGWWVATAGPRKGKRFTIKRKGGSWVHDYRQKGKSSGPVIRIGGGGGASLGGITAPTGPHGGTRIGQSPTGAPRAPSAPSAPKAPGTPGAPKPGAVPPQNQPPKPTPTPTAVPYRDSQYWTQLSKLQFQRNQSLAASQQEQNLDNVDYAEAIRRRLEQNPKDMQKVREGANREGLFYSGQLGKREGELLTEQTRTEADAARDKSRRDAARAAAREALNQGYTIDEAALLAEAADRKAQKDFDAQINAIPYAAEEEHGSEGDEAPASQGGHGPPRGKNVKSSYLRKKGALRWSPNADGTVKIRFKTGALRTLKQENGVWYIRRGSNWVRF